MNANFEFKYVNIWRKDWSREQPLTELSCEMNANVEEVEEQQEVDIFTPTSIVSALTELKEGERAYISVKHGSLQSEWRHAVATKGLEEFKITYDDNSLEDEAYLFSDEKCSLLSTNLWESGWYQLRAFKPVVHPTKSAVTAAASNEHNSFVFGGAKFPDPVCMDSRTFTLWGTVSVSKRNSDTIAFASNAKIIVDGRGPGLFFFCSTVPRNRKSSSQSLHFRLHFKRTCCC